MLHAFTWPLLLLCCMAPRSAAQDLPPALDPTGYDRNMLQTTVSNPLAQCNDGSRARYFTRNCTANADRAKGDLTDYCLKGSPSGVTQNVWLLAFESAPGFCHDTASCAVRLPRLKTADGLPSTLFPSGALSVYPEENPNQYKAGMAFVPSCSSDLWLGDNSSDAGSLWRGRVILETVLRELSAGDMRHADVVVVSGGAGVMSLFDQRAVRALLPPGAVLKLVCDDCLLLDAKPRVSISTQPCSTDLNCPAATSLQSAMPQWNASITGCRDGGCLLWPSTHMQQLLSSDSHFVFQKLFAEAQLRALRAWPPNLFSGARRYATQLAMSVEAQLKGLNSSRVFAPSCGSDGSTEGGVVSFLSRIDFFKTEVSTINDYNVSVSLTYSDGVSDLIQGLSRARAGIDNCTGFECNRVDTRFGPSTRCGKVSS